MPDKPVDVFDAIAHPIRREILMRLAQGKDSASHLAESFTTVSRPAISQHLGILRDANLVSVEKVGRHNFYHLEPQTLMEVYMWVAFFKTFWESALDNLGSVLDEMAAEEEEDIP